MLNKTFPVALGLLTTIGLVASGCSHDVATGEALTAGAGGGTATGAGATVTSGAEASSTDGGNTTSGSGSTTNGSSGVTSASTGSTTGTPTSSTNGGSVSSSTTQGMTTGGSSSDGMSTSGTTTGGEIEPEPEVNLSGGPGQCPESWGGTQDGSVTWYTFSQGTANIGDVNCSYGIQMGPDRVNHIYTGNGEFFAAMNTQDYNTAAMCGACVEVTRNDTGQKVVVTVVDQCPVGTNNKCVSGHLDLSQAAFSQIGNVGDGYLGNRAGNGSISWKYVTCPTQGDVSFRLKEPDNLYWNEVLVQNHKAPIQSVEVRVNGNWVQATRQEYNYWAPPGNDFGTAPFRVRATDIHGNFIEANIELQSGDIDTGFQLCD